MRLLGVRPEDKNSGLHVAFVSEGKVLNSPNACFVNLSPEVSVSAVILTHPRPFQLSFVACCPKLPVILAVSASIAFNAACTSKRTCTRRWVGWPIWLAPRGRHGYQVIAMHVWPTSQSVEVTRINPRLFRRHRSGVAKLPRSARWRAQWTQPALRRRQPPKHLPESYTRNPQPESIHACNIRALIIRIRF